MSVLAGPVLVERRSVLSGPKNCHKKEFAHCRQDLLREGRTLERIPQVVAPEREAHVERCPNSESDAASSHSSDEESLHRHHQEPKFLP